MNKGKIYLFKYFVMSHKILVSLKFISIEIIITKIVPNGNYPNSHKYMTVINIKVLICGKKY